MNNQRNLVRTLGLGYVIIFVIANIIGSGVFKKVAPMAAELHSSSWILMAWIVGGIITLFGALSNAEVAGLLADTGGDFVYFKKIYNRFFAFLYGWSLFTIIQTATISSLAYVFAQSLNSIIPLPDIFSSLKDFSIGGVFFPFQDFGVKLTAILLILLLTSLNISGLKSGAGVSKAILLLVCTGLFVIVFFGLSNKTAQPANYIHLRDLTSGTVTLSSFYTAMLAAFWAYQGWVSVGFIGGEVKNPTQNIPKGIVIGVFVVIFIYLLVNLTYVSLLSIPELESVHASVNQIAAVEAIRSFWGTGGVLFISLLILITTLGCTNASILTGARPYYAMARERLFFPGIAKLNKNNVPGNSLLWQGIWASVLVLSGTFDQLTDMVIFAVFIFYGATSLGVFILRRRMPDAHRPYKVWGYPVVPAIYILFCIGLFSNTIIARPREAAIGMTLILLGIPVFLFLNRKYSKKE
ncbi:MAG: amino acid permease [Bacteroidetes bacterium GWF2_42_66]|nr:MAG: amino acid permease [Bacteroidetes bacterium GWA2_42_15]OFX99167.1 MAG: amino acid permease [Bacteroidetes bacterium GWE2_42_39]OFY40563.1 MAG: amino acid permease [Bacteroidetes bacterium GWF2_42_66]HBL74514.1 amino acid permease [Prolixibacteraceae bacterium]HCR91847.1 amino acid permease [Prolixibacteraceae bacterium]